MNDLQLYRKLLWTGIAGLLGALLVGAGEATLQFSSQGGYEGLDYRYFVTVSTGRLTFGHFLMTFAAPLYVLGYWHLGQMFVRGGSKAHGWAITLMGGYAFVVGNAWLGGRVFLALTAQAIAGEADPGTVTVLTSLLHTFSGYNEPLVNTLRVAIALISVLWIWRIVGRKTLYPRWMAVFCPGLLLGFIFLVYGLNPAVGVWLLPAAMNVVHLIIFALSIRVLVRSEQHFG